MFQLTFLFLAFAAATISTGTVLSGLRGLTDPEVGVVGAGVAMALWAVVALNATAVEVESSGSLITQNYPSVRILATIFFGVMAVTLVRAAVSALGLDSARQALQ